MITWCYLRNIVKKNMILIEILAYNTVFQAVVLGMVDANGEWGQEPWRQYSWLL